MNDITNRQDVISLVDSFYRQVREHALLGPIFNEVAKVNWSLAPSEDVSVLGYAAPGGKFLLEAIRC